MITDFATLVNPWKDIANFKKKISPQTESKSYQQKKCTLSCYNLKYLTVRQPENVHFTCKESFGDFTGKRLARRPFIAKPEKVATVILKAFIFVFFSIKQLHG